MYTMGKLPSLSHHFIHGTITRTGIQVVLYSHVFNTNVFAFFYLKTLMFLFEWAAMEIKLCQRFFCVIPAIPSVFVRNIYIYTACYMYVYTGICIYISVYVSIYLYLYLSMYICIYVYTHICVYIFRTLVHYLLYSEWKGYFWGFTACIGKTCFGKMCVNMKRKIC